LKCWHKS